MRVAVVAEFYPRRDDPVLGVWAHRQALATRDAGAELTVFVLHRIVPPARDFNVRAFRRLASHPAHLQLDGLDVHYLRFVSPPRGRTYASWGAWAAPALHRALRRHGPFDLIHAHNAIPPGDAALRAQAGSPLVVSVHGGDVLFTGAGRVPGGGPAIRRVLARAELTLANSAGIAELSAAHGARRTEVVHLGADLRPRAPRAAGPLLVTVSHLVARKRHADVLHALARLPADVRYLVIGDGPERVGLQALAADLGLAERVEFTGQLDPRSAWERAAPAWLFVMPSVDEAFGVAYIEAMAAGIPAVGAAGEPGPAEILTAAAGQTGLITVPARDPDALAAELGRLVGDPAALERLGAAAQRAVSERYSWQRCGERTLAAYEDALRAAGATAAGGA